jgi:hypothetical protein
MVVQQLYSGERCKVWCGDTPSGLGGTMNVTISIQQAGTPARATSGWLGGPQDDSAAPSARYLLAGAVVVGEEVIGYYDADGGEWVTGADAVLRAHGWARVSDWIDDPATDDSYCQIAPAAGAGR